MASIRQLPSGRWQAQVRQRNCPAASKSFLSRTDAARWARQVEAERDRGLFLDRSEAERTTISDLIDRYLDEVTVRKRGAAQERYCLRILSSNLGRHSVARLSARDVTAFREARLAAGRSATTVRKELAILSHVIDTAIKDWAIALPQNPVRLVRKPAPNRPRDRRLVSDEYERLLLAAASSSSPLMRPIVVLAVETGMRLGELLQLEWPRIDLHARIAVLPLTKNRDRRRVPLSTTAVETLVHIPRRIDSPRAFWCWKDANSFEHAWRRVVAKAGLTDFRFHDLRHEATSRFFERGLNTVEVATITGHKTLQMLARYTHLRAENLLNRLG
jgi:integrase